MSTDDVLLSSMEPVSESFLSAMRASSIPLQHADRMRRVPLSARIYVNSSTGGRC
jgi:hypothetical protein